MAALFKVDIHAQMTRQANGGILNEEQLSVVILHNMLVDADQLNSCLHFDNCAFACGLEQINQQWALIDALSSHDRFDNLGLSAFGRLLHTTQDFYAHSNWVELHLQEATIPIWDLQLSSLPSDIVSGTFALDLPKCCGSSAPSHGSLNKDDPGSQEGRTIVTSGPHQAASLFQLAFDTGLAASAAQFQTLRGNATTAEIQHAGPSVAAGDKIQELAPLIHAMSNRAASAASLP
jgi:hypothetical protein